jgi:hypothetical protein
MRATLPRAALSLAALVLAAWLPCGCSGGGRTEKSGVLLDVQGPADLKAGTTANYVVAVSPDPQDRAPFQGRVKITFDAPAELRPTPKEAEVTLSGQDKKQVTFRLTVPQQPAGQQYNLFVKAEPDGGEVASSDVTVWIKP